MPNEFTSVNTAGLGTYTVTMAYDLLIEKKFREAPNYASFPWVIKKPDRPSHVGSSVRLQKHNWFADSVINASLTPIDEEEELDSVKAPATSYVDVTVHQYGFVNTRTDVLALESFDNIDAEVASLIGDHKAQVLDRQVQEVLDDATTIYWPGTDDADNDITNTHVITSTLLRNATTKLRSLSVPGIGGTYLAGIHPKVSHDLRTETGAGGWRVGPEQGGQAGGSYITGTLGTYEGVTFVENSWTKVTATGSSSANVYRTFIIGKDPVAQVTLEAPHFEIGPMLDKLNRWRHTGWKGVYGFGLYRDESVVALHTGSSVAAL